MENVKRAKRHYGSIHNESFVLTSISLDLKQEIVGLQRDLQRILDLDSMEERTAGGLQQKIIQCRTYLQHEFELLEVKRLQHDIRDQKEITIHNIDNHTARLFGKALMSNNNATAVEELAILCENEHQLTSLEDAEELLRFIETSTSLTRFCLGSIMNENMTRNFYQAVAANKNIENVQMADRYSPILNEMSRFLLEQSKSIKHLALSGPFLVGTQQEQQQQQLDLANTFRKNTSLQSLSFHKGKFLKDTNPFAIFTNAINLSQSLKHLELSMCALDSVATTHLLDVVCRPHSNVQCLELHQRCLFENEDEEFINSFSFFANAIKAKAPTAKFNQIKLECDTDDANGIAEILKPLQHEAVFGSIELDKMHPFHYIPIEESLPSLRGLKRLVLKHWYFCEDDSDEDTFDDDDDDGDDEEEDYRMPIDAEIAHRMVTAIRKNYCLQEIQITGTDFLLPKEAHMVEMCCQRNKNIQCCRQAPELLPGKALYSVLATCLQYEFKSEIIFTLLTKHWMEEEGDCSTCHSSEFHFLN